MDPHGQKAKTVGSVSSAAEGLRVQAAAVAAHQAALDEQEARLNERRAALDEHESQLTAERDEKRRQLLLLSERAHAEQAILEQDRAAFERHIQKVTGDLTPAQREILQAEQQLKNERRRLEALQQKLRKRWHRHWRRRQQQFLARQREQAGRDQALAQQAQRIQNAERALAQRRLRFNADFELARQHVKETWARLRVAQFRWKHRRGMERAALRVRAHELESAALQIAAGRAQLERDQRAWQVQRQALEIELDGVNARVLNQRQVLDKQQAELRRLDEEVTRRQQQLAALPGEGAVLSPANAAVTPPELLLDATRSKSGIDPQRVVDLDRLAEDLADQRLQLVEAWERVAALHADWHADRAQAAEELDALGQKLLERDLQVQEREQASAQADEALRRRHQDVLQLQQQIIAWRTRLRTEENAWESEKGRLLTELTAKEALATQQLATLVELRKRWSKRRKQETEELHRDRAAVAAMRKETAKLRNDLLQRMAGLEIEQRVLTEKNLALEQYRHDVLARGDDAEAERRLERLRRRWLSLNSEAIRRVIAERETLQNELRVLEERSEALERRAAEVLDAEKALTEERTAWEHKQALTETRQTRLEQDLVHADAQRLLAEQQLVTLRDEVEDIARNLLDQPETPLVPLDQAA